MCPACLATAAWILGGAIFSGGSGAVIVRALRAKKATTNLEQRRSDDGDSNNREVECESGVSGGLG
jgi:hypothetical protein